MKIFLIENNEWKLFDIEKDSSELKSRNIIIGYSAKIGNYAEIGDYAKIGDYAEIGYSAKIGDYAKIGNSAKIGNYAEIGNSAKIGNYAEIGYSAKIGNYAEIGNSAEIGNYAEIGDYAKITKTPAHFSREYIFIHMGILPNSNGDYTVYKAIKMNGQSFFDCNFIYKSGMTWRDNLLKKDQAIECGEGCHFTTYNNAVCFGEGQHIPYIIIEAKVNIDDILAVHQKMRVKAFTITRIMNLNF